jgi:hypothetical protein
MSAVVGLTEEEKQVIECPFVSVLNPALSCQIHSHFPLMLGPNRRFWQEQLGRGGRGMEYIAGKPDGDQVLP